MKLAVAGTLFASLSMSALAKSAKSVAAEIFVDYGSSSVGPSASQSSIGINLYNAYAESSALSPAYQRNVSWTVASGSSSSASSETALPIDLRGVLRYHRADMHEDSSTNKNGWVANASDITSFAWNRTRIAAVLGGSFWAPAARQGRGPEIMMNVGMWPGALSNTTTPKDTILNTTTESISAFAKWAADLVTMVNAPPPTGLGLGIRLWAVGNEWDSKAFYAADMGTRAAPPILAAAKAMRAAPGGKDILVGGPAFARPDLRPQVSSFLNATIGQLDFIDYHSYATGDSGNADSTIWDNAQNSGSVTWGVQHEVDRANGGALSGELAVPGAAVEAYRALRNAMAGASGGKLSEAAVDALQFPGLAHSVAEQVLQRARQHVAGAASVPAWMASPEHFWRMALQRTESEGGDVDLSAREEQGTFRGATLRMTRMARRNAMIRSRRAAAAFSSPSSPPSSSSWSPLLLHDEINISWAPPDGRMDDSVGAVFDVISVTSALAAGADSILRWNEADGWYGANNGGPYYERRPPSFARQALVAAFVPGAQNSTRESVVMPTASWPQNGQVVAASAMLRGSLSVGGDGISGCGGLSQEGQASLLLVNRAGQEAGVEVTASWGGEQQAPTDACPALFVLASQAPSAGATARAGSAWQVAPSAIAGSWKDASSVLGTIPQDGVAVVLMPWTGGKTAAEQLLGPDWSYSTA